uniref:HTH cro/C1-type domain-containing protein n=1 Tax=Thermosporothrix sp. COM3 TaxID=2490863 RepID=A0A455SGV0_9CHLR|nr:hypothetical protein KTC_24380 [Thermosporothrix sp. COM3]
MTTPNHRLKRARELRGWSQAKVARLIGTDAATVSRWERGLFSPTPYFREKLCELFQTNADALGLLGNSLEEPPPLPEQQDLFASMLKRAESAHHAHALWQYAYVQALRGQHEDARELGEMSLNTFEQLGNTENAQTVRAWLQTLPPAPPSPPSSSKRRSTGWLKGGGLLLLLLCLGGVLLFSLIAKQGDAFGKQIVSTPLESTPTATITAVKAQANNSISSTPALPKALILPQTLTPGACEPDSIGYRCTLNLQLNTPSPVQFQWVIDSCDFGARLNPTQGTGTTGQPVQVIVYIPYSQQHGSMHFTFTQGTNSTTAEVLWRGGQ